MKEFNNSAMRVLNLVLAVHNKPDQPSSAETWAEAFGLDMSKAKTDTHEVVQSLSLLRMELDILEAQMCETNFSEELYKPYIDKVKVSAATKNVAASWKSYKNNLSPETILSLRFCAEILPSELETNFDELEDLLSELNKFKAELDESNVNKITYDFVLKQLEIIEKAINNYPISGGNAIKKAFSEGFADLNSKADELVKVEDTAVTIKVGKFWKDLKTAGSHFVEADRIAKAYINIIEKGQSLSETIISSLPDLS